MTSKIFPFVFMAIGLASCTGNGADTSADSTDSTTLTIDPSDTVTFTLENFDKETYCFKTAELGYCKTGDPEYSFNNDSLVEVAMLKKNPETVKRLGETIEIITKKGKQNFKSKIDRSGMSDDVEEYLVNDVTSRFVVLKVYYYESYDYICVDLETGQKFYSWGKPVPSPDNNMVIAGNTDLMAAFTNNGLQLYVYDGKEWKLKMEKILDDWGPEGLFWISDTEVICKKQTVSHVENAETYKTEYVKLVLKQEKIAA